MKSRIRAGMVMMALLWGLSAPAAAAAETLSSVGTGQQPGGAAEPSVSAATKEPSAVPEEEVQLMIDSQNCYEGMEKPYADGYIPNLENGSVHLVVPILATGPLRNNRLQVSLDLGDGKTAPFIMKNYNKTIFLKNVSVNGGSKTAESFVADFRLELKEKRNNGSYPIMMEAKGIAEDGSTVSKEFRIYVIITDGAEQGNGTADGDGQPSSGDGSKDRPSSNGSSSDSSGGTPPEGSDGDGSGTFGTDDGNGDGDFGTANGSGTFGSDDGSGDGQGISDGAAAAGGTSGSGQSPEETPSFAPKILVESCQLTPENPIAGEEVTAEITLLNTSRQEFVKNMTITMSAASEHLTLSGIGDTVYIEKLSPQKTCVLSCQYQINAAAPQGRYELELSMEYADAKGNTYTAVQRVRLSSYQAPKILFDPLIIPAELAVADVLEVSAQAMNLGKTKVYNVRAVLEADGLTPEGTIFIGDMEPGTKALGSTQISVSGLSAGDSLYGKTEGTVTFYYEDETGAEQTESMAFHTTIQSPFSPEAPKKEEDAGQWWLIMASIGGILLFFGAFFIGRRVEQRKTI